MNNFFCNFFEFCNSERADEFARNMKNRPFRIYKKIFQPKFVHIFMYNIVCGRRTLHEDRIGPSPVVDQSKW